jgi:hypothetical protein
LAVVEISSSHAPSPPTSRVDTSSFLFLKLSAY